MKRTTRERTGMQKTSAVRSRRWRYGDDANGKWRAVREGSSSTASHCLWRAFRQLVPVLLGLLAMNQAVAQFSSLVPPPKVHRTIEDKKLELIETGLEFWPPGAGPDYRSNLGYGFWLSDTLYVTSVLQDVPDAFKQKRERVMLIDASTGESRVVIEEGSLAGNLGCRNRKFQVVAYYPNAWGPHEPYPKAARFVRMDEQGNASALTGTSPIKPNCDPIDYEGPPPTGNWSALREGDGYIDRSEPHNSTTLTRGKAKLMRPGKPPLALGIDNEEIDLLPVYLPYYEKSLLSG